MTGMMTQLQNNLKDVAAAFVDARRAVDEIRAEIVLTADRRVEVENAPVPVAEAVAEVDAALDRLAAEAVASVRCGELLRNPRGPRLKLDTYPDALLQLIVLGNRDVIRAAIVDKLEAETAGVRTYDAAARAAALAAIERELDALAQVEERLIRQAEAAGVPIVRREDARPEIVLLRDDFL